MIQVPTWFYVVSGLILVLSGILQLLLRPREGGVWRFIGPGPIFSVLSILLGGAVVYYGLFLRP